jgi:hypothetical protein
MARAWPRCTSRPGLAVCAAARHQLRTIRRLRRQSRMTNFHREKRMKHEKTRAGRHCRVRLRIVPTPWPGANDGHRIVGAIADKLIKGSNAEKQIAALLLPGESLESIAVWADCQGQLLRFRSHAGNDRAYTTANPATANTTTPTCRSSSTHYHEGARRHGRRRHRADPEAGHRGPAGQDRPGLNPHNFTRRQALLVLTHMAGDIHQPLHVGAAYVGKDGKFVVPKSQRGRRSGQSSIRAAATTCCSTTTSWPRSAPQ